LGWYRTYQGARGPPGPLEEYTSLAQSRSKDRAACRRRRTTGPSLARR
jgi:hypothetical protein